MKWEEVLKAGYRYGRNRKDKDYGEKRRNQDDLFDEANRNMRKSNFDSARNIKDFDTFRRRIMQLFPDYYAREDLGKFKESPALKNLYAFYKRMKGE
tara:strand:- start:623 stop:913 length:291 start_codon:yes stop_codon:yes gene_type:complete